MMMGCVGLTIMMPKKVGGGRIYELSRVSGRVTNLSRAPYLLSLITLIP